LKDSHLDREDFSGSFLDDLALPASQDESLVTWRLRSWFGSRPGFGKTLYIWYLLLRLLRMNQVVLLIKGKAKEAEEALSVEVVNYVLVRPAGQEEHEWSFRRVGMNQMELPLEHDIDLATTRAMRSRKKETKASTSGTVRLNKK